MKTAAVDWEKRYLTGDTPWEKGEAAPPLIELMSRLDAKEWGAGPVLVPGCGSGHDVRLLAGLGIPVLGLDLAPAAVERARGFPQVKAEAYELGNFLEPEWQAGKKFSALWEHTCFCAIHPCDRGRYAAAAADCVAVGGLLAGVFFLTPYDEGEMRAGPPYGTTVMEVESWLEPWFVKVAGWVPDTAYPGREGREWLGLFRRVAKA